MTGLCRQDLPPSLPPKHNYSPVCDYNNVYVVLSIVSRLVGFPPFWHRKQLVMLRSIMDGKYEFVSPEWDDISEQAKDLVSIVIP